MSQYYTIPLPEMQRSISNISTVDESDRRYTQHVTAYNSSLYCIYFFSAN